MQFLTRTRLNQNTHTYNVHVYIKTNKHCEYLNDSVYSRKLFLINHHACIRLVGHPILYDSTCSRTITMNVLWLSLSLRLIFAGHSIRWNYFNNTYMYMYTLYMHLCLKWKKRTGLRKNCTKILINRDALQDSIQVLGYAPIVTPHESIVCCEGEYAKSGVSKMWILINSEE